MLDLQKIPTLSGIYKFTNINSNKIYIGSAKNLKIRFIKHISNSIYNVLCGKRKQCKGFIFKYNEDIV